ncbi:beta-ketoacyl synthase N-terminal-like domain-containing protein, partial [Streptomyces spectabilis]|uniref:beta-ketoacyl synthase N-terminal-like domain-containing protein n=1 Tax=Streptomyces spectabilis TaxID=68270 RepID=UPI0033D42128
MTRGGRSRSWCWRRRASFRRPEDLWRLLTDGEEAITEFPEGRGWDTASLYD